MANILLLESDRQLGNTIKSFFKSLGYELSSFADPQQAVTAIDERRPDIIILNMNLAGHSGIEFLHELRSYPDWDGIPVIVTGQLKHEEQSSYADAFAQLKVQGYIHMPSSSLQGLLIEVNTLLSSVKA